MCQEGHFVIENISFYDDTKLGTELTAEADWKRRGLYLGPQVTNPNLFVDYLVIQNLTFLYTPLV